MPMWMKWTIALLIGLGLVIVGWRLSDSRWFSWVLPTFFVINCLVLIIVVLLQSGKAADLAGAFGGAGSQTAFGPRGAANVLSKATTWCAVMFMLCAMALVLRADKGVGQSGSILDGISRPASKPVTTPAKSSSPTPAPSSNTTAPISQFPAAQQPAKPLQAPAQPAPAQPKKP